MWNTKNLITGSLYNYIEKALPKNLTVGCMEEHLRCIIYLVDKVKRRTDKFPIGHSLMLI